MGAVIADRLTDEQKDNLITEFLESLGRRLKSKRNRLNLSQSELAACLDITQTALSKYESGARDMQISMLPLFSVYCKFPLCDLFPQDESKTILDTFVAAVSITVERKKHQEDLCQKKSLERNGQKKLLKGQIFEVNGIEVYEPVKHQAPAKSMRNSYRNAEKYTEYRPYTEKEFTDFVKSNEGSLVEAVLCAGQFLKQLENTEQKDTVKGAVADYIIDELIIRHISQKYPDESSCRAYTYYRKLYREFYDK